MATSVPSSSGVCASYCTVSFFCFVGFHYLKNLGLLSGGGGCCVLVSGVCLLCVFRSLCWKEDVSVYCDGPLHTPGNLI